MGIRKRFKNANQELVKGLKEDLKPTPANIFRFFFVPPSPGRLVNFRAITGGAEIIKHRLASMAPQEAYRVERFEDAIERLRLDEASIHRRRWELMMESRIMYALSLASIIAAAYFAVTDQHGGIFASFCALIIGTTGGFTRAFRVDQIDRRELYDFPSFFRRPEGWLK